MKIGQIAILQSYVIIDFIAEILVYKNFEPKNKTNFKRLFHFIFQKKLKK